MNPIEWLRDYIEDCRTSIPGINANEVVVDDSQLVKFLNSQSSEKNSILVGVIPDFSPRGSNPDSYVPVASLSFFILNKTGYSDHNFDEFIDIFKDTFSPVQAIVEKMLNDATRGCDVIRFLDSGTIHILPVWNKAGCNGWQILFDLDYPLW